MELIVSASYSELKRTAERFMEEIQLPHSYRELSNLYECWCFCYVGAKPANGMERFLCRTLHAVVRKRYLLRTVQVASPVK